MPASAQRPSASWHSRELGHHPAVQSPGPGAARQCGQPLLRGRGRLGVLPSTYCASDEDLVLVAGDQPRLEVARHRLQDARRAPDVAGRVQHVLHAGVGDDDVHRPGSSAGRPAVAGSARHGAAPSRRLARPAEPPSRGPPARTASAARVPCGSATGAPAASSAPGPPPPGPGPVRRVGPARRRPGRTGGGTPAAPSHGPGPSPRSGAPGPAAAAGPAGRAGRRAR